MGLLLCAKRAKEPLNLVETDKKIYSIEELCYYIYNNPYMINMSFFSKEFIEFVENGLNIPELGQKIRRGLDFGEGLEKISQYVLEASNYYTLEEKRDFVKKLEVIGKKTPAERVKSRADLLLSNKKYLSAIAAYNIILDKRDMSKDLGYFGDVANNMGVAYVSMFEYEEAINCFKKAYGFEKKDDYKDNIICAAILNDDEALIEKIKTDFEITEETFEQYKKVIENQTKQVTKSKEYRDVYEKVSMETNKTLEEYNKNVTELLNDYKMQYRIQHE